MNNLFYPGGGSILNADLFGGSRDILSLDVGMMSVAGFDDDFDVGVVGCELDEVRELGRTREIFAECGGGTAVFAVSDPEFLKLGYAACGHFSVFFVM